MLKNNNIIYIKNNIKRQYALKQQLLSSSSMTIVILRAHIDAYIETD